MSTQQALDDHAALVALLWDAYMTAQCEPGPMDWAARAVLTSEWLAERDAASEARGAGRALRELRAKGGAS